MKTIQRNYLPTLIAAMVVVMLSVTASWGAIISIPADYAFGNDTDRDDLSDFTGFVDGGATWSLTGNAARINYGSNMWTPTFRHAHQIAEFDGLSDLSAFTIVTTTTVADSNMKEWSRHGIYALGTSAGGENNGYVGGLMLGAANQGKPMSIMLRTAWQTDPAFTASASWTHNNNPVTAVNLYNRVVTLTLDAVRVGTEDWQLTLTAETPDFGFVQVSHTTTSDTIRFNNDWAGISTYAAREGSNSATVYDFHTFQIIPEPASLALLGLGGLMMMLRRRG